ncbi:MAG: FHA domain-containing protein [Anaerolineae bacterium]
MKTCAYCAHKNREGYFFCEDCGRPLSSSGNPTLSTRTIQIGTKDLPKNVIGTWGTSRFEPNATMLMVIRDAESPLQLHPERRLVFGRADVTAMQKPDVDLTPFGALEKGVSRIHCAVIRDEMTLTIVDLGSANGTHLNGQRLTPEVPRVLRDGDEVQLGKLVAYIYFKIGGGIS